MFDGNHRSRRAVNLGSRNNRNAKTKQQGRAAILEQTTRQRRERAQHQLRVKAASKVQTTWRGYRQRLLLLRQLQRLVLERNSHWNHPRPEWITEWTRRCNVLVRLLLTTPIHGTTVSSSKTEERVTQILQTYARRLPTEINGSRNNDSDNDSSKANLYAKYLWQTTLWRCRLDSQINNNNDNNNNSSTSLTQDEAQRILHYCLPTQSSAQPQPWKLLGVSGLLLLLETLLAWDGEPRKNSSDSQKDTTKLRSWLGDYVTQIMPQPQARPLLGVLQWTRATTDTRTSEPKDIATLVALVQAILQQNQKQPPPLQHQTATDGTCTALAQAAVQLLLPKTPSEETTSTTTTTTTPPPPARLLHLLQNVLTISSDSNNNNSDNRNATLPPTLVVPLVYQVWQRVPLLMHATSLVARSGNARVLQKRLFAPTAEPTTSQDDHAMDIAPENDDNDNLSEEDDDDDNLRAHAKTVTAPRSYNASTRVTKQDIQTTAKLERLSTQSQNAWIKALEEQQVQRNDNQMKQQQQQQQQQQSTISVLQDCAQLLASPRIWSSWGQILLTTTTDTEPQQVQARQAYMACLSLLLQGSGTGLYSRTSASSKFLTQLAFGSSGSSGNTTSTTTGHKSLVELLWKAVLMQIMNHGPTNNANNKMGDQDQVHVFTTWSVFCDVFCHLLIAVRDEQFLQQYTTAAAAVSRDWQQATTATTPNQDNSVVISAEHVIAHLRDALYELYWGRPVLAAETQFVSPGILEVATTSSSNTTAPTPNTQNHNLAISPALAAARVRFFLTGTKLWNSLYERWCRLLKHSPFCDESTWLFPSASMTTLTFGDGIVRQPDGSMQQDDANNHMDVDSDDDDDSMSVDDAPGASAQDSESDALAGAFQDPKMARILTSIPQCLPFDRRVKLFSTLLQVDKSKIQDESSDMQHAMLAMMRGEDFEGATSRINVEIRRASLYDDSMSQLNQLGPKLKRKLKVSFINQHGVEEAGIDGGGVFKEFLDDLIKDAFSPPPAAATSQQQAASQSSTSLQLFAVTPLETLMVNPLYTKDPQYLSHYEFLGRAVGKAVYESLLVEPQFCLPFLNTMLGKSNTLEDLKNYDPEYYSNLVKLMNMSREDIASTGLTFEVNLKNDARQVVELIPGGANKAVTKENVIQYAHLVSHRLLNVQAAPQIRAFLRGFRDLIPASWVRLFSSHELQKLVSGDDSVQGIDVASFKASMNYAAGYHPSQPVMQWFWELVENDMTAEQQCQLLKFMTSCSRQPLLGFASLEPQPCIQQIRLPDRMFMSGAGDAKQLPLPTSATCMNLLKLPNYRSKEVMRQKLFAAIEAGAGFELS